MHIRELRKKTTVYESVSAVADPIEWPQMRVIVAYRLQNGEWSLEDAEGAELVGYIHPADECGTMSIDKLPVEFFNHQLMDYDPASEESVRSFVTEWGFPFLPLRSLATDHVRWIEDDKERIDEAYKMTADIKDLALILGTKYWDDEDRYDRRELIVDEDGYEYYKDMDIPTYGDEIPTGEAADDYRNMLVPIVDICDAISFKEASLALEMLQWTSRALLDSVREGKDLHGRVMDTLNLGGSNSRMVRSTFEGGKGRAWTNTESIQSNYSLLTAAICNQMIDAIADPIPWRDCACEGCGITFKRKQSKANAPTSDSIYCCSACEERQKKRNQRAAAKNRIQH